jgi:hypothetical protein
MGNILSNKYSILIITAIGSMLLTILAQYILSKRSRFRYNVWHSRVGLSTDDSIFGSVRVTWNNTAIPNLYLSTVELVNESMKDYENITVRVYTRDAHLLSENTEIVGTTYSLNWTEDFFTKLQVVPGQAPLPEQIELHSKQRDYLIPVINRGQVIRFGYLNSAITPNQPTIWLDILHKGIKLKFGVAHNKIYNVAQPTAALVGIIVGIVIIGIIITCNSSIWMAAILSFLYGLFAQIPGAFTVKLWRKVKQLVGG